MEPRLVAITGPLKGTTIPLKDRETVIGRDPGNAVSINDPLASRHHCTFRSLGTEIQLSDLNSLNGTFVNDQPTSERTLKHGDRVKVGNSIFIFLVGEEDAEMRVPFTDSFDGQLIAAVTVKLDCKDLIHLPSGTSPDSVLANI